MTVLQAAFGWGPHRRRVVDILQLGAAEGRARKHPQPWVVHRARHWRRSQNQMPHQRTLSSSFQLRQVQARLALGPGIVWVLGSRRWAGHTLPGEGIPPVVLPLESSRLCLVVLGCWEGKRVALVTTSAGGIDMRRRVVTAPGTPQSVSRQRNRVNLVAYRASCTFRKPRSITKCSGEAKDSSPEETKGVWERR
jgi:hypothetical protein